MATKLTSLTSFPITLVRFIKEARDELKKVSWPSREQTVRYTLIVIVSSLAIGLVIGGMDYILTLLVETYLL